jgi:hypothetical protein
MRELSLADRVTVPEAVVSRELDGETVVLNLETGIYFGLDAVATDIWRVVQAGGLLQEAFDSLRGQYEVDAGVLRDDLLRMVNQMAVKGLVQAADHPTAE